MKFIMILITVFFSLFMNGYSRENRLIENIFFEMYSSNFNDFIEIEDGLHLNFNEHKITTYLESKGYKSNVYTNYDGLHIQIKTK